MTRRAAAGLGRLLPLLLIAAAVVIVAGAALLAACGGSTGGSSPQPTATVTVTASSSSTPSGSASPSSSPSAAPKTTLRLYFLRDEKLGVAERRVAHTSMPASASVQALLAGPTAAERSAGLTSAVPADTKLLGLTISGTTAQVDLSEAFASGGGSLSMTARVAEVVYTLTRFPTVRSVEFLVEGTPVEALGGEGVVLGEASAAPTGGASSRRSSSSRRASAPRLQPVHPQRHGQRVRGDVPGAPRRLVGEPHRQCDRAGQRGAPGRGGFAKEIAFSTSAKRGTLIVSDQSMEDGSRQNEVRIPVTFSTD